MLNESVLDVLMYIVNRSEDDESFGADQERLSRHLIDAGFSKDKVKRAFCWLEDLVDPQKWPNAKGQPMRVFSAEETRTIGTEQLNYLLHLEQIGVLDAPLRERIIGQLLALQMEKIKLDDVKWVILMVLSNDPDLHTTQEQSMKTDWLEQIILDDEEMTDAEQLH